MDENDPINDDRMSEGIIEFLRYNADTIMQDIKMAILADGKKPEEESGLIAQKLKETVEKHYPHTNPVALIQALQDEMTIYILEKALITKQYLH
jgi:hypothetical protein